jgi:hypothetical protein
MQSWWRKTLTGDPDTRVRDHIFGSSEGTASLGHKGRDAFAAANTGTQIAKTREMFNGAGVQAARFLEFVDYLEHGRFCACSKGAQAIFRHWVAELPQSAIEIQHRDAGAKDGEHWVRIADVPARVYCLHLGGNNLLPGFAKGAVCVTVLKADGELVQLGDLRTDQDVGEIKTLLSEQTDLWREAMELYIIDDIRDEEDNLELTNSLAIGQLLQFAASPASLNLMVILDEGLYFPFSRLVCLLTPFFQCFTCLSSEWSPLKELIDSKWTFCGARSNAGGAGHAYHCMPTHDLEFKAAGELRAVDHANSQLEVGTWAVQREETAADTAETAETAEASEARLLEILLDFGGCKHSLHLALTSMSMAGASITNGSEDGTDEGAPQQTSAFLVESSTSNKPKQLPRTYLTLLPGQHPGSEGAGTGPSGSNGSNGSNGSHGSNFSTLATGGTVHGDTVRTDFAKVR